MGSSHDLGKYNTPAALAVTDALMGAFSSLDERQKSTESKAQYALAIASENAKQVDSLNSRFDALQAAMMGMGTGEVLAETKMQTPMLQHIGESIVQTKWVAGLGTLIAVVIYALFELLKGH